jgi:succinate dehydrogenase/fumarate reductase cytochrome b subunit
VRYFALYDFQNVMLLSFLGLVVLILLYIAFNNLVASTGYAKRKEELEEFPEGIQTGKKPIPLILIFVYAGFIVWAMAYAVVIGIRGGPF